MIYVVLAYRFGQTNTPGYLQGVYLSEEEAIQAAKDHREYRGGKYEHRIFECEPGKDYDTNAPLVYTTCEKVLLQSKIT